MKNDKLAKHLQFFVAWQMAGLPSLHRPDKSLNDVIEEMYNKYMCDDVYRFVVKRFEATIRVINVDLQHTPTTIPQDKAEQAFMALVNDPPGGEDLGPQVRHLLCSIYATHLYSLVCPQADTAKCSANVLSAAEKLVRRQLELTDKATHPNGTYVFQCKCGAEELYRRFDATQDIPAQTDISVIDGHVQHITSPEGIDDRITTTIYDFMNFVCPDCGRIWESEDDLLKDGVLVYKSED